MNNCTWANNIFYTDSPAVFTGTAHGQSFAGNIYEGTLGLPILRGVINIDPLLVLNTHGYYGLSSTSFAIGASSASYPVVLNITGLGNDPNLLLNIEGQPRPVSVTLKDVGCDQYTTGTVTHYPLALCNAGPSYLSQAVMPTANISASQYLICAVQPITLHAAVTAQGATPAYQWQINGNNAGPNDTIFTTAGLTGNTLVSFTLASSLSCTSQQSVTSNTIQVVVDTILNSPTITQHMDTLFSSAWIGNQWYLNNVAISGANGNYYLPTQNGSYWALAESG